MADGVHRLGFVVRSRHLEEIADGVPRAGRLARAASFVQLVPEAALETEVAVDDVAKCPTDSTKDEDVRVVLAGRRILVRGHLGEDLAGGVLAVARRWDLHDDGDEQLRHGERPRCGARDGRTVRGAHGNHGRGGGDVVVGWWIGMRTSTPSG